MNTYQNQSLRLFLGLFMTLGLLLAACQSPEVTLQGLEEDTARLDSLLQEMEMLIADKTCNEAGVCKTIAYGEKACGGPVGYLVYSSSQVNETELQDLADEYTALNAAMNEEYNLSSDCSVPVLPDPSCESGQCE